MTRLRVRLLSDFGLWYEDQPVARLNSPRLQSLLAYLVLHGETPQPRQHIAFLFWPESNETQAFTNLRNLLYKLRRALPDADQFLRTDAQSLQWREDSSYSLDVVPFERAVNTAEDVSSLRNAVDLYRGDLLPGFYDEWIEPVRDRLRQQFRQVLEQLVDQLEQQREYQIAIRYARRLLRHDPIAEKTHRDLMRLLALMGDRAGALRTYHTCATTLHRELGIEPESKTRQLYQQLLNEETPPISDVEGMSPKIAVPSLVGREQEWVALQSAWHAARRRPRMILVSGEAGIGKTCLADELFEWVRRQGMAAVRTRAYAAEGSLAYAPVAAWLQDDLLWRALMSLDHVWLTELARILPQLLVERLDLSPPEPLRQNWQRLRLFEALARAVLAVDRPLLLQIDDLQWCDQESLQWLHYLLRYDTQRRVLLVATARTEDVDPDHPLSDLLVDLRQSRRVDEIKLQRLDEAEITELANHLASEPLSAELIRYLVQETEGNPLFIVEMIRAGLPASLDLDHETAPSLPPSVQAVISARLAHLSPAARELAALAAVIGRAFTFEVLNHVSDAGEDAVVRALDELWQRRIVRPQTTYHTDTYDFSHDKIRETAYAGIGRLQRRLWHRRVAETLYTRHASNLDSFVGQIATHYERAGLPDEAIPHYQRAAELAQQHYANGDAIKYLEKSLALLNGLRSDDRQAVRQTETALHEHLGDLLHLTGRYEAALRNYHGALAVLPDRDPLWRSRLHLKVGNIYCTQHAYPEAQRMYDSAESSLGPEPVGPDPTWWSQWVQIQIERMWVYYWIDYWSEIAELAEQVQAKVASYGTPPQQISFLLAWASIDLRRDRYMVSDETVATLREALLVAIETDDPGQIAWVEFLLGMGLLWRDEFEEAEARMDSALQAAEKRGDIVHQSRCLTYLAILQRRRGRITQLRVLLKRCLQAAKAADMLEYVGTATANQAWIEWCTGDVDAAKESGQAALSAWQKLPAGHASCAFQWTALWPLLGVALHRDEIAACVTYAQMLLHPSQQRLPEKLTDELESALQANEHVRLEDVKIHLQRAVTAAHAMGYL